MSIVIEDLANHPRFGWVAGLLATAKSLLEKEGELQPMLFCSRPKGDQREITVCPIAQLGDIGNEDEKDLILAGMRLAARQTKATECALLIDAYASSTTDDAAHDALIEAGKYDRLSAEHRRKIRRRDVIWVQLESLKAPYNANLAQAYRMVDGEAVFEELILGEGGAGRFSRILHRPEVNDAHWNAAMASEALMAAADQDSPERMVEWFVKFGGPLGFSADVGDTRILLIRGDGSVMFRVERERAKSPESFDRLRDAFRKVTP